MKQISIRHFFSRTMGGERDALNRLYREIFGGPDGRRILADLFSRTFWHAPAFAQPRQGGGQPETLDPQALAYFRGQQDLVRLIAEKAGLGTEDLARAFAEDDLSKGDDEDG